MSKTAAVIGSFKVEERYALVRDAVNALRAAGIEVMSPAGSSVIESGIDFVRFTTDDESLSDAAVQTLTLERILSADAVYVIAPDGYVGRTTCYEIGRIVQAGKPIYFSEAPDDLPVAFPDSHVVGIDKFIAVLQEGPSWPFTDNHDTDFGQERALIRHNQALQ